MMSNLELWISRSGLNRKSWLHSPWDEQLLRYLESLKEQRLNQEKINQLVMKYLENYELTN